MFINLSNHDNKSWSQEQLSAAQKYGKVIFMPFPRIDTDISSEGIDALVDKYYHMVMSLDHPVVMLQGETDIQ